MANFFRNRNVQRAYDDVMKVIEEENIDVMALWKDAKKTFSA